MTISDTTPDITLDVSEFSIEDCELGDLLTIQEQLGIDVSVPGQFDELSRVQQIQVMIYLLYRRQDSTFTWDDTRRVKLDTLTTLANVEVVEASDPT